MFLLSPKDSTLALFLHGTISKMFHPTGRLLVCHISFQRKIGNHMKPWDLFRYFFSDGSSGSLCRWFSSFSFLVSACGSVRHRSLVKFWSWRIFPNPPIDGESSILWIFLGTPSLIIGAYHVHVLFMRVPRTYISRNSFILLTRSASTCTGASTVLLGIFRMALVLPVRGKIMEGSHSANISGCETSCSGRWEKSEFMYLSSLSSLR